jgi:uncharacterized cupin superfamily protein
MADVTVKRLDDFESMSHEGMTMMMVRAGLGVDSFGLSVVRIPPNNDAYPEHDHSEEGIGGQMFASRPEQLGQEEIYTVLDGAATLVADGQEWRLEPGVFARVEPHQKCKIVTGEEGVTLLALGGTPGRAFSASSSPSR